MAFSHCKKVNGVNIWLHGYTGFSFYVLGVGNKETEFTDYSEAAKAYNSFQPDNEKEFSMLIID